MASTIESVLHENRVFQPPQGLVKQANISGMATYEAMCKEAESDFEGFWAKHARNEILWTKPFTKTLDESNAPFYKWFHDGELNASENCLAKPRDIRFGDNLPKTRSGKIMRRLLRSIAKGEDITQDVSTLENPAILEQLKKNQ